MREKVCVREGACEGLCVCERVRVRVCVCVQYFPFTWKRGITILLNKISPATILSKG